MTPLRIGILSYAHLHAASYAQALRQCPDAQLVGIADWAMAHAPAKKVPEPVYVHEHDLLAARLDAVIVTSENARHRKLVEQAADAGVIHCDRRGSLFVQGVYEGAQFQKVRVVLGGQQTFGSALGRRPALGAGERGRVSAVVFK